MASCYSYLNRTALPWHLNFLIFQTNLLSGFVKSTTKLMRFGFQYFGPLSTATTEYSVLISVWAACFLQSSTSWQPNHSWHGACLALRTTHVCTLQWNCKWCLLMNAMLNHVPIPGTTSYAAQATIAHKSPCWHSHATWSQTRSTVSFPRFMVCVLHATRYLSICNTG